MKKKFDMSNILVLISFVILLLTGFLVISYSNNPMNHYFMGYKTVHVLSATMEPTIKSNSIVIAENYDFKDLKVGDIIIYKNGDNFITHRINKVENDIIYTKGDNLANEDGYAIKTEDYYGKVKITMNWTKPILEAYDYVVGFIDDKLTQGEY